MKTKEILKLAMEAIQTRFDHELAVSINGDPAAQAEAKAEIEELARKMVYLKELSKREILPETLEWNDIRMCVL